MIRPKKTRLLVISILISLSAGAIYFSYRYFQEKKLLLEQRKTAWANLSQVLERQVKNFNSDTGILIKDLKMDWEIVYNPTKPFPVASLIKVPIMLACFYAASLGRINLQDKLTLKPVDKVLGSGILKDMASGSTFSVSKLIELMIVHSDNTATNMLIDLLGFDYLNNFFQQLGLKRTNLSRKMMDFSSRRRGLENYTTAQDIAYVFQKIYEKKFLNYTVSERCLFLLKQQQVNDRIPLRLPSNTVVAHKTGLERKVCHDAGIVFTRQGDFLICILTGGRDSRQAKKFIAQVAFYVYSYSRLVR